MNNSKQKRHLLLLARRAVAFFVLFFVEPTASAQISHSLSQIPIGNSDRNGFVRIDKVFYEMPLGNGRSADFFFKFSSDPHQEPLYMGAYWKIPFFDSNAVKTSGNRYVWESPNHGTYTFNKSLITDKGYKETYILNTTGKWKLNVSKDDTVYINNVNDEKNRFVLKNGRLISFCVGKDADVFRISYGNKGVPQSVYNITKNSVEIECVYNKEGFLSKIILPKDKKAVLIAYDICDTFAEDGITKQGKLLKSVSSMTFADGKKEEYKYFAEENKRNRTILTKKENEKTSTKVSVNRFEQKIGDDNKGFIEWDATTGIIVSDSGGEYAIRNPIFDKRSAEYGNSAILADRKREIKTKESRISYKKPENKYAEIWDYSLRTAVKIVQNPNTGEQTRTSYIGNPGNASMKIRKIEKKFIDEKNWNIYQSNIYNDNGDMLRAFDANGNLREFCYDGNTQNGSFSEILNGVKIKTIKYKNGVKIYEMRKIKKDIYESFITDKPTQIIVKRNNFQIFEQLNNNNK